MKSVSEAGTVLYLFYWRPLLTEVLLVNEADAFALFLDRSSFQNLLFY